VSEAVLCRPGILAGPYPERGRQRAHTLDRLARGLAPGWSFGPRPRSQRRFLERVGAAGDALGRASDAELAEYTEELRQELLRTGLRAESVERSFALTREVAGRTLGTPHYDVQLLGGFVMIHGRIAEMATGEGKTLTATLPACAAALAGIPVHVLSANDYLVKRDAEAMGPVYEALGLTVGVIQAEDTDPAQRRAAYAADVTYVTGQQVAFDYLRDRLLRHGREGPLSMRVAQLREHGVGRTQLLLRGLCFGILDEADSLLIDEARTPLILSGAAHGAGLPEDMLHAALELARALEESRDFEVHADTRRVELTAEGRTRCDGGGVFNGERQQEEWLLRALSALHLYARDRDYLVRNEAVEIIDSGTGRVMEGRSWEGGLHQLIELKEGCPLTPVRTTLARMSYQRFFRRYHRLSGMTGTAREVGRELRAVYGLATRSVPSRKPLQRRVLDTRVFARAEDKWRAVVEAVTELHREQRPVLVGTGSLAESEELSDRMRAQALPHRVLNARQDAEEAAIVARAGRRGAITVATNMAGRGTDIELEAGVAELGGLHVIATERSDSRRIDRQLAGRSARQGEPGSFETILSLEDRTVSHRIPEGLVRWAAQFAQPGGCLPGSIGKTITRFAQRAEELASLRARRAVMELEDALQELLAFSGSLE